MSSRCKHVSLLITIVNSEIYMNIRINRNDIKRHLTNPKHE